VTPAGWTRFFAREILGLIFFMAGWYKCFTMTPLGHAATYFTGPYADTWIPHGLLLATGVTIPVVELLAGALLIAGFRVHDALIALGIVLLIVTYGHLLKEPLYSTTGHIFPRFVLLGAVFLLPAREDRISVDAWLASRRRAPG
jgi:thiosulfate dehydrogenase (quinone) large subunit